MIAISRLGRTSTIILGGADGKRSLRRYRDQPGLSAQSAPGAGTG